MIQITSITADPKQQMTVIGEAGEQITVNLYFDATQNGWFADFAWGTWAVTGFQLLVGVNVFRQWKNIITFGLAISTTDGYDPAYLPDFVTQRIQLYLLNAADVQVVEEFLF